MIKVSFIVIAYNIEEYIERCIKSILRQDEKDIEIIVVNDGSTDNTLNIINSLSDKDNRIKVISQSNSGANVARKIGYLSSKGKYICFIDGDDWVAENLVSEVYNIAIEKNYDIVQYNYLEAYEKRYKKIEMNMYNNIDKYKYLELNIEQKIVHTLWNKIFKRSFLEKSQFNKIPNITMGDDLAANILMGIYKPRVKMVDKVYYYYYQRNTAITKTITEKSLEILKALEFIEELLRKEDLYNQYQEQVEFLWFIHCYFSKVVKAKSGDIKVKKKIYDIWKKRNINLKKNHLYKEYYKNLKNSQIFMLRAYNLNFYLGHYIRLIYSNLQSKR